VSKPSRASNELPASTTGWVLREGLELRLKLDPLKAALALSDLAVLPGNRFEALKGSRKGQYSIRVNDQWRVCFEWPERSPGPANVEIVDDH